MDLRRLYRVIRRFVRSLPNRQWFRFFTLWLAPFLLLESFFFATLAKGSNLLEFYPGELILPSLMHAGTALLVAFVAYKVKSPARLGAKLMVAVVLGLLFVDYTDRMLGAANVIRIFTPSFVPRDNDLALMSLLFLGLLFGAALWLGRRTEVLQKKHDYLHSRNLAAGFFIFVGVLAAGNILRIATALPTIAGQAAVTPAPLYPPDNSKPSADKPDIYYIVLDRYTNQNILQDEFNYDNAPFVGFLEKNGFTVRDNANASYPFTDMSIASTLTADYLQGYTEPRADAGIQSHALFHNLVRQSSVVRALKGAGYSYTHVGTWYNATSQSPLADARYVKEWNLRAFGQEKTLTSLEGEQFSKSPYYAFLKAGLFGAKLHETTGAALPEEQLLRLQEIAETPSKGGRFIFAHMLVTHPPYYFNADGSYAVSTGHDNVGKLVRSKYTDQLEYANKQLEELVETIKRQSGGKAIILLTSDEGPHPVEMNPGAADIDDLTAWSDQWLRMKYGVLQAAYIPKATEQDLQQLSSVNMFRIVLNRYLGFQLDYLPQCSLALPKGRDYQFVQSDVTRRLTGEAADPFCSTVVSGSE